MKKVAIFCVLLFVISSGCVTEEKPTLHKRTDVNLTSAHGSNKEVNWMGHWLGNYDREPLLREVAQNFELMNPDIQLNLKFPQQIMGFRSKQETAKYIAKMIRTGNIEWDVIWMDDQIYQYTSEELDDPRWGEKYLVNFEEVPGFKATQKSFIVDDPVYRKQIGGMIVGPYIEGYYHAIYYNQDVAEKMGIEIKQYGMTVDDLLGSVKQVSKYNQEHNTNTAAFSETKDWTMVEILFQNLFKSELQNFSKTKEEVGSDEKNAALLKSFQVFEELGRYDPLIDSHKDDIWYQTRHLVLDGKCLFYIHGIWMYSHWMGIDEEKTKKMIPCELPVFQPVDYYSGGFVPTWAVMKDAPNKEEAIKLVMSWSTPRVAEKWVRTTKMPTGLFGEVSSTGLEDTQFDKFQAEITDKYGSNVHYSANAGYIFGEENQDLSIELEEKLVQLLNGEITAQVAYDEIMGLVE